MHTDGSGGHEVGRVKVILMSARIVSDLRRSESQAETTAETAAEVAAYLRGLAAAGRFALTTRLIAGKAKQALLALFDRLESAAATEREGTLGTQGSVA